MQHREQQAQVARDRRLEREQRLDRALDVEEKAVDLVVEGDDLVRELLVLRDQRVHGPAERPEDEV